MSKTEGNVKFVAMMVAFFVLALFQQGQQGRQDTLIERQKASVVALCENQNRSSSALNALIDDLVVSARDSTTYTPAQTADRISRYQKLTLPTREC